ncbi:MAG: hypothetical protein EBS05_16680 [Proteobacteria bacterium]|nr:hypothetical protein [Pseudomonadota bacterium]
MAEPDKQTSANSTISSLVKAVLEPSAKLLGAELKTFLKESIDAAKERRRNENLGKHIAAVRDSLREPLPDSVTYQNLERFGEWAEGAQDVGDEEPMLTKMWREVLCDILKGKPVSKELVGMMKQVDGSMAALLLSLSRRKRSYFGSFRASLLGAKSRFVHDDCLVHANRLEAVGLVERDYGEVAFDIFTLIYVWVFAFAILDFGRFGEALRSVAKLPMTQTILSIPALTGAIIGSLAFVFSYRFVTRTIREPRYRVTWAGNELLKYAGFTKESAEKASK